MVKYKLVAEGLNPKGEGLWGVGFVEEKTFKSGKEGITFSLNIEETEKLCAMAKKTGKKYIGGLGFRDEETRSYGKKNRPYDKDPEYSDNRKNVAEYKKTKKEIMPWEDEEDF